MREFFLATGFFISAFGFSMASINNEPGSSFWLLCAIILYMFGLNETINMICKPFMQSNAD